MTASSTLEEVQAACERFRRVTNGNQSWAVNYREPGMTRDMRFVLDALTQSQARIETMMTDLEGETRRAEMAEERAARLEEELKQHLKVDAPLYGALQKFAHDTGALAGENVRAWFIDHQDTLRQRWEVQDELFAQVQRAEFLLSLALEILIRAQFPTSEDVERGLFQRQARAVRQSADWKARSASDQARIAELEGDALRWRALLRCGQIKMQGSSGVNPHTHERNGNNVHFGAEFWPEQLSADFRAMHPIEAAGSDRSTAWGVACLIALADAVMEQELALLTPSDGESK